MRIAFGIIIKFLIGEVKNNEEYTSEIFVDVAGNMVSCLLRKHSEEICSLVYKRTEKLFTCPNIAFLFYAVVYSNYFLIKNFNITISLLCCTHFFVFSL